MSDRYGRKGLIFWTLIPALLTQALILYMSRPGVNLGVWILYVDALMMGLTGGGLLLEPGLSAYIGKFRFYIFISGRASQCLRMMN